MNNRNSPQKRILIFENFRGEVAPEFDDIFFLDVISRPEEIWNRPDTEILVEKRNKVGVARIPTSSGPPRAVVIKEFAPRGLVRLKSIFQSSKAVRAWRGAIALKERGLETAPPIAYLERRHRGLVERSFFFAARIEGAEEVRTLFRRLQPAELGPLLAALAGHLSLCHDRGILHRDLSDGNVLVKRDDTGRFVFFLLDTNRIRLRTNVGPFRRAKNLIRLGIPRDFQKNFVLSNRGTVPLRRIHWLWYKWNKSAFTIYVGLKKKLRLRQIARFLRIQ